MDWEQHREWAKNGISEEKAQFVNVMIDHGTPLEYTSEMKLIIEDMMDEIETSSRDSAFSEIIAHHLKDKHDASRITKTASDAYATAELRFLKQRGQEYVDAWYLHHHLDYLWVQRNSNKDIEQLFAEYQQNYPNTHSQKIEESLREHIRDLVRELIAG